MNSEWKDWPDDSGFYWVSADLDEFRVTTICEYFRAEGRPDDPLGQKPVFILNNKEIDPAHALWDRMKQCKYYGPLEAPYLY